MPDRSGLAFQLAAVEHEAHHDALVEDHMVGVLQIPLVLGREPVGAGMLHHRHARIHVDLLIGERPAAVRRDAVDVPAYVDAPPGADAVAAALGRDHAALEDHILVGVQAVCPRAGDRDVAADRQGAGDDAHARVKGLVHRQDAAADDGQIQIIGIDQGPFVGIGKCRSVQGQRAGLRIVHNGLSAQHVAPVIAGHPDAVDPEPIGVAPLGGERQILGQLETAARGIGRRLFAVDAAMPAGEGPTVGAGEAAFGQGVLLALRDIRLDRVSAPLAGQKRDDHPLIAAELAIVIVFVVKHMRFRDLLGRTVGAGIAMLGIRQTGVDRVGMIADFNTGIGVRHTGRFPVGCQGKAQDRLTLALNGPVGDFRPVIDPHASVAVAAVAASEGSGGVHAGNRDHGAAVDDHGAAVAIVTAADARTGKLAGADKVHEQVVGKIRPALIFLFEPCAVVRPQAVVPDIVIIQIAAGGHHIAAVHRQRAAVAVVAAADARAFVAGDRVNSAAVDCDVSAVSAASAALQRTAAADARARLARGNDERVVDINVSAVASLRGLLFAGAAADARAVAFVINHNDAAGDANVSALVHFRGAADARALALHKKLSDIAA